MVYYGLVEIMNGTICSLVSYRNVHVSSFFEEKEESIWKKIKI